MSSPWPRAHAHLSRRDARLRPVVRTVGPVRLAVERNRFQALAESILYQQLAGAAAESIVRRVREANGGRFPDAAELRALSDRRLRACGVSPQKLSYLKALAREVDDGLLDLSRLSREDDEAVVERLVELPGIGRWTAEMFLIFSLGRPDVLPVGDYGVRKGMQRLYGLRALPLPERMREIAEPWRPYRSAGSWYLWRSLSPTVRAES
ncbi:MAG TPA: DNA-3-methyladenine glycosylase [Candidatus Thermoplasmatota archaeon]|nr:DNA-3-methyladenine glycosylase [Candidatus Thermoplasmatota archaeon]